MTLECLLLFYYDTADDEGENSPQSPYARIFFAFSSETLLLLLLTVSTVSADFLLQIDWAVLSALEIRFYSLRRGREVE